jgi:hypothetical protein
MSTRRRWLVLAGIALVVVGLVTVYVVRDRSATGTAAEDNEPYTFAGDSEQLERTVVVPTLDTPIPEHKTAIWCLSFQVAWNRMKDFEKEPLQLEGAGEVCGRLNEAPSSEDDMTTDMYYATAGMLEDGYGERIQQEMAERFPKVKVPAFPPVGLVAFCHLTAELRYPFAYDDAPNALVFNDPERDRVPVHAYGIVKTKARELQKQPAVLFRDLSEQGRWFALDLCKDSSPYQLVAARIPRKSTLAEMLADLESRIVTFKNRDALDLEDTMLIPNMRWKIDHHFRELEGRPSLNKATAGKRMMVAFQMIDFKINRRGASVESKAVVYKDKDRAPRMHDYRYDTPFLLYMKKRGAKHPFLAMWIDNAELLQK